MKEKIKKNKELTTEEDWNNEENEYREEIEDGGDAAWEDRLAAEPPKKESLSKRILSGLGMGSLVVGGGILFTLFGILHYLFPAVVGLLMIWWAIVLFLEGSIIWGLLVLLIGTPIAIGIASYAFIFLFFLAILAAIIWGIIQLFGGDISFWGVWDVIWLIIVVSVMGFSGYLLTFGFIQAIKEKKIAEFFKETWFYILLFLFFFWLFFL